MCWGETQEVQGSVGLCRGRNQVLGQQPQLSRRKNWFAGLQCSEGSIRSIDLLQTTKTDYVQLCNTNIHGLDWGWGFRACVRGEEFSCALKKVAAENAAWGTSGGGGDPTDTLAPHFIGGDCEISSSAHVAACLYVRIQSSGWFSPFTSTHFHPSPPGPASMCLTPVYVKCHVPARWEEGRQDKGSGTVGGGEARKRHVILQPFYWRLVARRCLIGAFGPFGERLSGRMSSGDMTSFTHCVPLPQLKSNYERILWRGRRRGHFALGLFVSWLDFSPVFSDYRVSQVKLKKAVELRHARTYSSFECVVRLKKAATPDITLSYAKLA